MRCPAPGSVEDLHAEVDREAALVAAHHAGRLECRRGCSDCCIDGLTVFEVEAQRIREACGERLRGEAPHPEGACAFLDREGACRVWEHRPYVCRTQGLPLSWHEETEEGEILEHRDVCELNLAVGPLDELEHEALWTIGPFELRLAALQARLFGGSQTRVALRDLFGAQDQ